MKTTSVLLLLFVAVGLVGLGGAGVVDSAASLVMGDDVPVETPLTMRPVGDADSGAFTLEIRRIDRCGTTCAEVTALVGNARQRPATDVRLDAAVFAGGSATDGRAVLHLSAPVGTLEARSATLVRRTVTVPVAAARTVRQHGGRVTVEIRVASASATTVFRETKRVG